MPVRAALNVVYALLTDGLDTKQRQQFDTDLYGWGEMNDRANRTLRMGIDDEGGGEG
jgi:hypothetical protein